MTSRSVPFSLHRRDLLRWMALPAVAGLFPLGHSAFAAVPGTPLPGGRRLIVVMLRGAVDGLSIVAPYTEGGYAAQRPSVALARPGQANGALDLDGHFGLHPALQPLMPYWQGGQLAFVQASGSPDPTRSHFDAQDFLETGTPGHKATPDGWLNRLLGAMPASGPAVTTRGLAVGSVLPRIWAGTQPVAMMAAGPSAVQASALDRPQMSQAFDAMYGGDDALAKAYHQSRDAHKEVVGMLDPVALQAEMKAADRGAPLPNGFPGDAARLATLMRRDPHVQVAFLALGGWDTHARQGGATGQLGQRLQPLGAGLAALANGLGPVFEDTTIVVMSEFGRTVAENGTAGTDHGHGNVMWILGGGRLAGGRVHGRWPGIDAASLHDGRDLAITTDFRDVLSGVLARRLGLPDGRLDAVFPGYRGAPLDLVRA